MHYDAVIAGRYSRNIGIGQIAAGILACLSPSMRCAFLNARPQYTDLSTLPADIPVVPHDLRPHTATALMFTDVLWNHLGDQSLDNLPRADINLALSMFDSSSLPTAWVSICNDKFDAIVVPDEEVKGTYEASGVWKPVFVLPVPLDLEPFFQQPLRMPARDSFTFGTVASYHPRKNLRLLISSFLDAFGPDNPSVRLVVHSNLNFGAEFEVVRGLVTSARARNITLSCSNLSEIEFVKLLSSFDAFVQISQGEGYSIPPRQALALGLPCVLSDSTAHRALCRSGLVFSVPAPVVLPAVFEEISGMTFGAQETPVQADVVEALRRCHQDPMPEKAEERRAYARQFSIPALAESYTSVFRPASVFKATYNEVKHNAVLTSDNHLGAKYVRRPKLPRTVQGARARKRIVMAHDGGYFSVFNTFLSHLVWYQGRNDIQYVLPDWRINKMMGFWKTNSFTSFCYGRPEDENIWLKLYEPLYDDVDPSLYNQDEFLYSDQEPFHSFNAENEPLLTYVHAYKLYRIPEFDRWRQWYHNFYRRYVRVLPHIRARAEEIYQTGMAGKHCIGVHARHPSHAIEQPDGTMPYLDRFVELARGLQTGRKTGQDWRIFLATDQEAVVKYFQSHFEDRVVVVPGLARTTEQQDATFQGLSAEQKHKEGFQIQHLTAADQSRWNTRMAEEVIVDALLLAKCNSFVHTTSNIATAVSYMNPDLHMVYCE